MAAPDTSPPLLRAEAVRVCYGKFCALDGVSVDINSGEITSIIGPNGAGKTSLIRALCGRVKITSGHFLVDGKLLRHGRSRQHIIGLVPQDIALYPHMSARENLNAFAKIMGMRGRAKRRDAVTAALETVELLDKANTPVHALSGGMKRRINVAAAIMHEPKILILDEPTAGTDIPARDTLHRLARRIADTGKAVLLVTHELEAAEAISDRLLILAGGHVLAYDRPAAIMNTHFSTAREVVVRFISPPDPATQAALAPFKFTPRDTPTEWSAMTHASEVSFVSAFMASLRSGSDQIKEISVRRPGLTHLIHVVEKTGAMPEVTPAAKPIAQKVQR